MDTQVEVAPARRHRRWSDFRAAADALGLQPLFEFGPDEARVSGTRGKRAFQCHCGRGFQTEVIHVLNRAQKSCGCARANTWAKARAAIEATTLVPLFDLPSDDTLLADTNTAGVYRFRCSCGEEFSPALGNIIAGSTKSCGHALKRKWRAIAEVVAKVGAKLATPPGDLNRRAPAMEYLDLVCKCGRPWAPAVQSLFSGKAKSCGCENRWTWGRLRQKLSEADMKLVSSGPDTDFVPYEKIQVKCSCGRKFRALSNNLSQGITRSCGCVKSRPQTELVSFLEGLGLEVETNARKILPGRMEVDAWVPQLKLAIEYDGLFWHGERCNGKEARSSHLKKLLAARENGTRLVTVFADEWLQRRHVVEARLRAICGRYDRVVNARACSVVADCDAVKILTEQNHLQGAVGGQMLGLYHDGELVAGLTMARSNASRGRDGWELTRYVASPGVRVRGGFSKLLKTWMRQNPGQAVVSYSDNRWSEGEVYRAAGFRLDGESPPSYWYFPIGKDGPRRHRFGLRKSILVAKGGDPAKTEWELAQEAGWDRIWDAGCRRWILDPAIV